MTQFQAVKQALLENGYVTRNQVVFYNSVNVPIYRLGAVIFDIKKSGVRIISEYGKTLNKKLGENRFGDGDFIYYTPEFLIKDESVSPGQLSFV